MYEYNKVRVSVTSLINIITSVFQNTKLFRKVNTDGDKQHLQNDLDRLVKWSEKLQMLFNLGNVNAYIQDMGT